MASEILDISTAWSRAVIEFAAGLDPWMQEAVHIGTDLFLAVFAVLFLAAWWRSRSIGPRSVGLALFAPVVTVIAYGVSRTVKAFVEQLRPCQAMTDLTTIATCDAVGDWSFPSNHSAIAGAAAAAIIIVWRKMAPVAAVCAVLEAFSRVLVGAHYPHDVTAGLLLGAAVATAASLALARPLAALIDRIAKIDPLRPLVHSASAGAVPARPGGETALAGTRS